MKQSDNQISENVIDFIRHCDGYAETRRQGKWLLEELIKGNPLEIEEALKRCLKTLNAINKEGVSKKSEAVIIDRTFELNYRTLGLYLRRKIKKDNLEQLQRINYYVQAIIHGDVKNIEKHYQLNKNL